MAFVSCFGTGRKGSSRSGVVRMSVRSGSMMEGIESCGFSLERQRKHRVFVYGTLKRGYPNSHLLTNAELEGHFETEEKFPLVVGGEFYSPYLLNRQGEGYNVRGEVYRVDDDMLEKLDELERVGINYTRKPVAVRDGQGTRTEVLAYLKCNYTRDLLEAEYLPEYKDKRYVPRHMRNKVVAERQKERMAATKSKLVAVQS